MSISGVARTSGTRTLCATVLLLAACQFTTARMQAAIFGTVRVDVHDPQGLMIMGSEAILKSVSSDWQKTSRSNAEGVIELDAVPIGHYTVTVKAPEFATQTRQVEVSSATMTQVTAELNMGTVNESVNVAETSGEINAQSSTTETMTAQSDIVHTPDADRSGSLAMITDYVPGTYVMHDHLHARGGHGVTWQIDGVPVPNSNLASVGSQFDPKDVDVLETQRGGYSAEYGDRSYGVFNVVPRTGFEGTKFAEFVATYGSFNQTNDFLSFGDHKDRFGYYGSVSGYRTDFGLERVSPEIIHDQSAGFSGFTSLIFTPNTTNQFRLVSSYRQDHYQVPNVPEQQAAGIRDTETSNDAFTNVSWIHTPRPGVVLTVAPYYHYNESQYSGGKNDLPVSPLDNQHSNYMGGYITLAIAKGRHSARFGTDSFGEHDNTLFGITANDGRNLSLQQQQIQWAGVTGLFAEDQIKFGEWLTVNGGARFTHFTGNVAETSVDPRLGAAIRVPKVRWVLRGSYGRYYQHPPLNTIGGPLLDFALQQGFGFLPVRGERDETWEVGLGIPLRAWSLDFDYFHNNARNVVDHQVLGNSNLLFPVSIQWGRIYGEESTLRAPWLWHKRLQFHWALSHQTAQARGDISGRVDEFRAAAAFVVLYGSRSAGHTGQRVPVESAGASVDVRQRAVRFRICPGGRPRAHAAARYNRSIDREGFPRECFVARHRAERDES